MRNSPALLLMLALGPAAALAAPAPTSAAKPALKPECVINMDMDKADASIVSGKGGVATGNVVVTQCGMKMRADTVRVTMANNQYDKIIATGKVVLISEKSGVITGDNGVYEVPKQFVTMTGHVVLKNGKDVFTGTRGSYDLTTGFAHVDAPASSPGSSDGRVHAILTPPPDSGAKSPQPSSGAK
jgi:lipopolysaccharide export system protein LptA